MSTNIIKVNRGDSYNFKVGVPEVTDKDTIYFALLYPHQRIEDAIILRGWLQSDPDYNSDTGELTIKILSSDTINLAPGIYYYTVKLQRGGIIGDPYGDVEPDKICTIIERTKFIINE